MVDDFIFNYYYALNGALMVERCRCCVHKYACIGVIYCLLARTAENLDAEIMLARDDFIDFRLDCNIFLIMMEY